MLMRRHSEDYNFIGDTETGVTMRWGRSMGENPLFAPWPELVDISISNHCSKGCDFCYRDSRPDGSFLSVEDYEFALDCLTSPRWGSVFQVALGGGEPLEHPQLLTLLECTRQRGIGVNFTTNGDRIDDALARQLSGKVGAVALSVNRMGQFNAAAAWRLYNAGIRVNLHFVLDRFSLGEAIDLLRGRYNDLLAPIRSVIFLTYKPAGRGPSDRCLIAGPQLDCFLALVDSHDACTHVGFDACFVPQLLRHTQVDADYIDPCECAFFSIYINERLQVKPCSFAPEDRDAFDLRRQSMESIWSKGFDAYRTRMTGSPCHAPCAHTGECRGRCSYFSQIALCYA
jgi:MoaA/NifB/PqqE/SkfB family radical SAM enzyme